MRRSRAEKAETHERILDAAARRIRAHGPEGVSISELMKAADLTHGGFYKHFGSRDALIYAAVARAAAARTGLFSEETQAGGPEAVRKVVGRYLSESHRDNIAAGCAIAALAGDVSRQPDPQLSGPVRELAERGFARMNAAFGGDAATEEGAVFAWCAMLGALTLSRVFRGEARSGEILDIARRRIAAMADMEERAADAGEGADGTGRP